MSSNISSKERYTIGSYNIEIANFIKEFNEAASGYFEAENRVLVPSKNPYEMDKKGIIIEHIRKEEFFEEDYNKMLPAIRKFATKLDKRTCLYEYPFVNEFADKDSWTKWGDKMVAYNFNL